MTHPRYRKTLGILALLLPALAAAAEAVPVDVMLVLDNSGSMRRNDPRGLMREVVTTFAERLPKGCRLGLVHFDQEVHLVLELTETLAENFAATTRESLERLDYGGRWTDLPAGIERATYELRTRGRPDAEKVVVFLTDGIVDLGDREKDRAQALWLRESLAVEARDLGIRIFGVAFTEAADFRLIQSVTQTTRGEYFRVMEAADIPTVFETINLRIEEIGKPPQPPPPAPPPPRNTAPETDEDASGKAPSLRPMTALVLGGGGILLVGWLLLRRKKGDGPPAPPLRAAPDRPAAAPRRTATLKGIGSCHDIVKETTTLGRDPSNDVVIDDDQVSLRHAEIFRRRGSFFIRDLRSSNGTFLNRRLVSDRETAREVMIRHNDVLRIGGTTFDFLEDDLTGRRTVFAGDEASAPSDRVGTTFLSPRPELPPAGGSDVESAPEPAGLPFERASSDPGPTRAESPRPDPGPAPEPEPAKSEPEPTITGPGPAKPGGASEARAPSVPATDATPSESRNGSTFFKPNCEHHPNVVASYRCERCGRPGCGFCIRPRSDSPEGDRMLCAGCVEDEGRS